MTTLLRTILAFSLIGGFVVVGAEKAPKEGAKKKVALKCPVSGAPAKADKTLAYKGASVQFCCDNCPKAFAANTAKFATKANHQLALTKQARQAKCPLSGGPIDKTKTAKVAGVKVGFCCEKCQGKVAAAEGDDQLALVFADAAFDKGFKIPKKKGKKKDE